MTDDHGNVSAPVIAVKDNMQVQVDPLPHAEAVQSASPRANDENYPLVPFEHSEPFRSRRGPSGVRHTKRLDPPSCSAGSTLLLDERGWTLS